MSSPPLTFGPTIREHRLIFNSQDRQWRCFGSVQCKWALDGNTAEFEAEHAEHLAAVLLAHVREAHEGLRADHYHADTCGSVLTPNSGYECTCWKRDLRALTEETRHG